MCIAAAAAVIGTGASIAGQVIGFNAQNKAAWDQRAYNMKVEAQEAMGLKASADQQF